ncbi:hypothetical protein [Nocardia sp. NPDC058480]|uniref:hypothetical protein n=1 Tax=Nocardia sp. NPDC058480 TaxID=3346522 RepID=UPI00365EDE4B
MKEEPKAAWQAELEATAGYEHRGKLRDRALDSSDPAEWNAFRHWMRTVVWPAELAVWKNAGDWYARELETMSPRRRSTMPQLAVRCPVKGCSLGTVYEFRMEGGARRFYFVGKTSGGKRQHGICNWAFADSWDGLDRWWQVGCRHGHVKVYTSELIEAAMQPPTMNPRVVSTENGGQKVVYGHDLQDEHCPVEYQIAWRTGIFIPPQDRWMPRGRRRQGW